MNKLLARFLMIAFAGTVAAGATETYEFNRYQVILDKSPFGAVSSTEAAAPASFAANFTLVALVYSNSTVPWAIIQDKAANRSLFRAENETIDDVKVLKIDVEARKVTLQKGLEKATLAFEQRSNTPTPAAATALPQPPGVPPGAPPPVTGAAARRIPFRRNN